MKKYKILIIDDDKFLSDMYVIKFKEEGFDVVAASGSSDTLDKLEQEKDFDIVLMDVVMPKMDGFELLEKIKTENLAEGANIIMLSNLGQKSDVEKGYELGADGYIIKAGTTPSGVVKKTLEIAEGIQKKLKPKK